MYYLILESLIIDYALANENHLDRRVCQQRYSYLPPVPSSTPCFFFTFYSPASNREKELLASWSNLFKFKGAIEYVAI